MAAGRASFILFYVAFFCGEKGTKCFCSTKNRAEQYKLFFVYHFIVVVQKLSLFRTCMPFAAVFAFCVNNVISYYVLLVAIEKSRVVLRVTPPSPRSAPVELTQIF